MAPPGKKSPWTALAELSSIGIAMVLATVIAVGNFRWLASRVTGGLDAGSTIRALWTLAAVLRLAALAAAVGLVLVSGHAHPLAVVCGLSVLPVAVVAHGLRGARAEA